MSFNNVRVATKLWLAVGVIVASLALLIGLGAARLATLQADSDVKLSQLNLRVKAVTTWAGLTESNSIRTLASVTATFDSGIEPVLMKEIAAT